MNLFNLDSQHCLFSDETIIVLQNAFTFLPTLTQCTFVDCYALALAFAGGSLF